jgi:hypothetical protein
LIAPIFFVSFFCLPHSLGLHNWLAQDLTGIIALT